MARISKFIKESPDNRNKQAQSRKLKFRRHRMRELLDLVAPIARIR